MVRVVFIDGPVDGRTEEVPSEEVSRTMHVAVPRWLPTAIGGHVCTDMHWDAATYHLALITVEGTRVYTWTR